MSEPRNADPMNSKIQENDGPPARPFSGKGDGLNDLRDTRGGTFGELPGEVSGEQVKEHPTPHEIAQWGADVRPDTEPREETLPQGLVHREGPMNKTTGRRPAKG